MSKIGNAIGEINRIDEIASRDQWVNEIHPLVKFVLTVLYIGLVVSFHKYDVIGLVGMGIYPFLLFLLSDLSFWDSIKRLKLVLPILVFVGALNPFLDQRQIALGSLMISAGWLSMITLILKGFFAVLASYLLIATTTVEKICYSLRLLHVPKIMVTQLMLTYRYITVLLHEVKRITEAYALRAPKQKGIHYKAWGSLVGQLLLRSMDRAGIVYESMTLRGYQGDFSYFKDQIKLCVKDVIYFLLWLAVLVLFRKIPVLVLVGQIFIR